MTVFDKNYFGGDEPNRDRGPCKDINLIEKIYFPKFLKSVNLNKNSRILDVGCGFGYFLKSCDTICSKTYGVDISKYAIEQAKKQTRAKLYVCNIVDGLHMFQEKKFDAVTMFDVIEHLDSPYRALKEVYRVLKDDGKIIITTPNLNAIHRIFTNKNWYGYHDKSHLYLFYMASLEHIIERAGFKNEKIETPFHPLPKILQKIANKTNLGGQIWLVARK